jgi:hypothetical protein
MRPFTALLCVLGFLVAIAAQGQQITPGPVDATARNGLLTKVSTNHTGNVTITGNGTLNGSLTVSNGLTVGGNSTLNGTANLAPNQTAASGSSLLTRDLADERYKKVFALRPSDIAAFGATAAMQRDFPGGGQMAAARFSAISDAASFWLTPPPAGKTQLVVRAWVLTTNSGVLASALQVGDLPVSGGRTISVSNIFDHGTSAVGTNLNIITNTINVTVSGQVQGLSWVWLTNTTGSIWFTYGEGWWQ